MSIMEALAITKPVAAIVDSTEDERTNNVQPRRVSWLPASDLPPMYMLSWLSFFGVLLIIAFYYFLVCSFFINGLYGLTHAQIWSHNNEGGGDFPFSSPFYSYSMNVLGFFLIFPAILISGTAGFFFPFYGMALMGMLGIRWRTMAWGARLLWLLLIAATVGASLVAASSLGHSMLAWIGD